MKLSWLAALRSSRVLDDRTSGHVDRSQSVVHALLSAKDQVPMEAGHEHIRRRIAQRVESITPDQSTATDVWALTIRRLSMPIVALVLLASSVMIWSWTHSAIPVTNLPGVLDAAHHSDDPDPDVLSAAAPKVVLDASPARQVENSRVAIVIPNPPSETLELKRDAEGFIRGVMETLPIRNDEPR
jgi:hypothetical protein